jgi:type VI secretion system secreted protein VgrG
MKAPFSQAGRLGKFHTDRGLDELYLLRFSGTDSLNALFDYRVEALSADEDLNFDELLGTHGRVEIETRHGPAWFDGIITRAVWMGPGENGQRYDVELRPWLWLATKRRSQRIFHQMTAPQIIEQVCQAYAQAGSPHLENRLTHSYPVLEYTVQYRESDFAFVSRLMERFGINYYFRHENGSHTLIMIDNIDDHDEIPDQTRPYTGVDGHHQADDEHFWEFHPERNITTGGVRLTDFEFKNPAAAMETENLAPSQYAFGDLEAFDYPGDYLRQRDGATVVAPRRMREERSLDSRVSATGDVASMKSGMRVGLTGDHLDRVMKEIYVCLSVTHSYVSDSYGTGGKESDGYSYQGKSILQPVSMPVMPLRRTPLPIVQGPQTATMVGEGEIDCDEFGRILVRFPWDLEGAISMRCRVSQNWAGSGWGGMVIPRIGMEVVVEFLEGDPDKPIVTGCVYNGRNMPPYDLPADKTKSVFKTDTHEGRGYNELTFEDQRQNERIYMHAEKDLEIEVLNDRTLRVTHDDASSIDNDRTVSVGHDQAHTVANERVTTVGANDKVTIGQNLYLGVSENEVNTIGSNEQTTIGSNRTVTIGNNDSETVAADKDITVGANATLIAGDSITLSAQNLTLTASTKLTLMTPAGKLTIGGAGITLEGAQLNLKGMTNMQAPGMGQMEAVRGASADELPLVEECDPEESG